MGRHLNNRISRARGILSVRGAGVECPPMEGDWITTSEAARISGYTVQRVRQLIHAGEVQGRRFGRDWMVDRSSLLAYMERAAQKGKKRGPKTEA